MKKIYRYMVFVLILCVSSITFSIDLRACNNGIHDNCCAQNNLLSERSSTFIDGEIETVIKWVVNEMSKVTYKIDELNLRKHYSEIMFYSTPGRLSQALPVITAVFEGDIHSLTYRTTIRELNMYNTKLYELEELYEWLLYAKNMYVASSCCTVRHIVSYFLGFEIPPPNENTCYFRVYLRVSYCVDCGAYLTSNIMRVSILHNASFIITDVECINNQPSVYCERRRIHFRDSCTRCNFFVVGFFTDSQRHIWGGILNRTCQICGYRR